MLLYTQFMKLFKTNLIPLIDFPTQMLKIFIANPKMLRNYPKLSRFEYIIGQISHKTDQRLLIYLSTITTRLYAPHNISILAIILQIPQVLFSIGSMKMVVVDFQQNVLLESESFAIDDDVGADIALHFPDLVQLLLVFEVAFLPSFGFVEVECPFYGGAVAVGLVEEGEEGLFHLGDRCEFLDAFGGQWEFEELFGVYICELGHFPNEALFWIGN